MRNNLFKFILAASLVLNITILGTAGYKYYKQSGYWTTPFGNKIKKDRFLFEELSLKPAQMKAMKEKAIPFRAEIDGKRNLISQKQMELLALMRAENADKKAIDKVISEISERQEEMQRMITWHILEVRSSLEREQQGRFLDLIENAMRSGGQMGCPNMK